MRSTAVALNWMTTSVGNYIGTLLVSLVHKYSGKKKNWLPNRNLNRGRLEYYYWLVIGIQVINLIYYVICAYFYTYKPLEEVSEKSKENGVDLTTDNIPSKPLNGGSGDGGVELARNDIVYNQRHSPRGFSFFIQNSCCK
ncbi:hypothetical protein L1049_001539 [Liquidambar formosana]|uniref:Uncharacterized protein n=1 Tax=Liquidambar formosana TaxID=63359 RepID=A0AAP0R8E0_LIQFO